MRTSASRRSHDEGARAVTVAGEPSEATMILLRLPTFFRMASIASFCAFSFFSSSAFVSFIISAYSLSARA